MKINKRTNKKTVILIVFTFLVLVASIFAGLYYYRIGPFANPLSPVKEGINMQPATQNQIATGVAAKDDFMKSTTEASVQQHDTSGATKPNQEQGGSVSVIISSANINGSTLSARTIIQTIDADGVCEASLSKSNEATPSQQVGTQTMGSYSTCKGFDIDISSLKGDWELMITYKGSSGQSGSTRKTLSLQ